MSVLTRIKNNQILDSTIYANAKIVPGSIVGSLFNTNLTMTSDVTITGNLTVQGASTYLTVASTNTYVNDPLIVLNNAFSGTNTYDLGFVFNRGTLQNVALIWNEFNKEFRLVGTTETGTTYGNINQSSSANLRIGNLTVDYVTSIGSLITTGFINTSGNISAATGLFGAINSTGLINTTGNISASQASVATINATGFINTAGNISASEGSFATVNATGLINTLGNISTAQLNAGQINTTGNVVATVFNGGAVNVSGNVLASTVLAQLVTADDATFGNVDAGFIGNTGTAFTGASINLSGNVLASTVLASYLTASTATVGNISAVTIGNTGAIVQGLTAQFNGNVIGGLAQFAALNATPVGNATASTGAFTTLSAANNFYANASIATTAQGLGAVVIPNGGISVSGAANIAGGITTDGATQLNSTLGVGGITTFTNSTNATSITDGAVKIQGGASVLKDLYVGGNLYAANIVGITANVITVEDPLLFLKPSYTFPYNYDIGIYSSFQGAGLTTAGNVLQHTGVVRHQETNTWTFASNLAEPGSGHVVFDNNTVYDPIKAGNLELTVTTDATSATTGALIVAGGAGIGGNIFHSGTRLETSASNYIFASTPTTVDAFKGATDLEFGATSGTFTINNPTVVGTQTTQALYNTVADTINFGRAANITLGINAGTTTVQGNLTVQSVKKSTAYNNGALTISGGLGIDGNIFVNDSYLDTAQPNFLLLNTPTVVDAFKAGTDIEIGATSGTLLINNPTVVGSQSTQALYNTTATTLNFGGAATALTVGAATGFTAVQNANLWLPNLTSIDGAQANVNIFTTNATQAQLLTSANLSIGASVGTTAIRNTTLSLPYATSISVGQTSVNFANATATTVNAFGSATTLNFGAGTGITTVRNRLIVDREAYNGTSLNGAFRVVGTAAMGSNLFVGNGAVINDLQTSEQFKIRGTGSSLVFFVDPGTQTAVINGPSQAGNTATIPGATFAVRSTDSLLIPVGSTAQRPGNAGNVDVTGMLRYNTSLSNLEWFNGSNWAVPGAAQSTVITDESFSGNGVQTTFTLANSASTNSCIVSINGVLQIPVTAYGITGSTLIFTEAPAVGDAINVRKLTTTSSITSLASANGYMVFDVSDASGIYANITGGVSAPTVRTSVSAEGILSLVNDTKIAARGTVVNIVANATPYTVDSFTQTRYVTAKYIVSAKKDSTNFESYEALVTTDQNGNAYITTYGIVNNGTTMGILSANVLAGNVQLYYTTNTGMTNANVRVYTTYIQ
jgi:hypothetical protein